MIVRILTAIALALLVTLGLFFLMQTLIDMGKHNVENEAKVAVFNFVRMKRQSHTQTKRRVLPQKQKMTKQPDPPSMKLPKASGAAGADAIMIVGPGPTMDTKISVAGGPALGSAPSDAGSIPLVRIQPMYPRGAAERRIEGWVLIRFTISKKGTVKNARMIEAKPPGVFDRAALQAIRKWKYKPKIRNGVPVATVGVQVKLTFRLDEM